MLTVLRSMITHSPKPNYAINYIVDWEMKNVFIFTKIDDESLLFLENHNLASIITAIKFYENFYDNGLSIYDFDYYSPCFSNLLKCNGKIIATCFILEPKKAHSERDDAVVYGKLSSQEVKVSDTAMNVLKEFLANA